MVLLPLEAIARSRTRINDVLTAMNASASHGILLYLLRKVASNMCEAEGEFIRWTWLPFHLYSRVTVPSRSHLHAELCRVFVVVHYLLGVDAGGRRYGGICRSSAYSRVDDAFTAAISNQGKYSGWLADRFGVLMGGLW